MAVYPNALPNLPANHVDNIDEIIMAEDVNDPVAELNAALAELGTNPSDTYSSVKARLDAIGSGGGLPGSPTEGDALVGGIGAVPVWSPKGADYNLLSGAGTSIVTGAGASAGQAATNKDAINTVLAAAAAQGRPVLFPPVTIMHTTGIVLPSNTHVRGFGKGRSIWRTHASVGLHAGGEIITNSTFTGGNDNITLENFEIDGNSAARGGHAWMKDGDSSGGQLCFHSSTASRNIRFLNLTLHHAVGVGINMSGVDGYLVQGCQIYSNGRDGASILLVGGRYGNNIRYIGNSITDCGDDCIGMFSEGTPITNVAIVGNLLGYHSPFTNASTMQYGGHAVAVAGGGTDIVVANNVMPNCGYGAVCVFNDYIAGTAGTARITVANNMITLPGTPRLPVGVNDSGQGIELICQSGATNISDVTIIGNTIQSPMGHMVTVERRGGTGTIGNVRIANNTFNGGFGANYLASGAGISVTGAAASNFRVNNNTFTDLRGKAIAGNGLACAYWKIQNNDVVGCEKGNPGAGGPAIDLANFVSPHVSGNSVTDFASPKNQSHALGWGGASGVRLFNNDFGGGGRTGTVSGAASSKIQHANVDNAGAFIGGDHNTTTL